MPHYKCVACKTRLYSAGSPADQVGDLCPDCGSLLQPVSDLADLVGFRSIKSAASAADGDEPGAHQRIANRVEDFLTRREEIIARREALLAQAGLLAQSPLDAERWLDDGGSFSPEAVAEAMALPVAREDP